MNVKKPWALLFKAPFWDVELPFLEFWKANRSMDLMIFHFSSTSKDLKQPLAIDKGPKSNCLEKSKKQINTM